MSTILFFVFLGPISWFWHPQVMVNEKCIAEPGSYSAVFCEPEKGHAAKTRREHK